MKCSAPAPGIQGPEPFSNRRGLNGTRKPKGINHLKTLQDIANRWASEGFYATPDRALRALVAGDL